MLVVGNVDVRVSFETLQTDFDNDTVMTILGNFNFKGGPGVDLVQLNGTSMQISGDLTVDLRGGTVGAGAQTMRLNDPGCRVGGNLTVKSRSSDLDTFLGSTGQAVGGTIKIDLGPGNNAAQLVGLCSGSLVSYKGGNDVDTVTCDLRARRPTVKIKTRGGDDTITLVNTTNVRKLTIDGGGGADTLNDGFVGPKPFKTKIKNVP